MVNVISLNRVTSVSGRKEPRNISHVSKFNSPLRTEFWNSASIFTDLLFQFTFVHEWICRSQYKALVDLPNPAL